MFHIPHVAALALVVSAAPSANSNSIILSPDGKVERYYGVPVEIRIDGVGSLNLKHRRSSRYTGEGFTSTTEIISGLNGVDLVVIFNRRGDLAAITTKSRIATDQRGVKVGNTLKTVQKLWPCGKLYYGVGEGQRYARFFTGSNVWFEMTTASFANLSKLVVEEIRVVDHVMPSEYLKCSSEPHSEP